MKTALLFAALWAATPSLSSPIVPRTTALPTPSDILSEALPTTALPTETNTLACTITLTDTHWGGCPGLTETVYPGTVTSTKAVKCGVCSDVFVETPLYMCPMVMPTTTVCASAASTAWTTTCAITPLFTTDLPTVSDSIIPPPGYSLADEGDELLEGRGLVAPRADCTTTVQVVPLVTSAFTYTWFGSIATTTVAVPCDGCDLAVDSALVGPQGPQYSYDTTVTVPVMTSTMYTCMTPEEEAAWFANTGGGPGSMWGEKKKRLMPKMRPVETETNPSYSKLCRIL